MLLLTGGGLGDLPFKNLYLAPAARPTSPAQVHQVYAQLACRFEDGLTGVDFSSPADRFEIDHITHHRLSLPVISVQARARTLAPSSRHSRESGNPSAT
jgi:hypothetical protein